MSSGALRQFIYINDNFSSKNEYKKEIKMNKTKITLNIRIDPKNLFRIKVSHRHK